MDIQNTQILIPNTESLSKAAKLILDGELVAFPTETVYGLGADATNDMAIAKVFEAKGRPSFNPLIIHGHSLSMLQQEVMFDDRALSLADKFWPGPMTLILPRSEHSRISELATAGLKTIAVRIPSHKIALDLIEATGVPIAAPSANLSGTLSPTAPHHVQASLNGKVAIILAGGATQYGLESTVIDLSLPDEIVIVRAGAITTEDIEDCLSLPARYELEATDNPKSPGQLLRHYAPSKPIRLKAIDVEPDEALLAFGSTKFMGIRGGGKFSDIPDDRKLNLSESGDLLEAASHLFAHLRMLDNSSAKAIAVMDIPNIGIGIAINDRLKRASQK
jgi:L-threonylcarbamoyladenylate synthase